jgi:hypothetical protein
MPDRLIEIATTEKGRVYVVRGNGPNGRYVPQSVADALRAERDKLAKLHNAAMASVAAEQEPADPLSVMVARHGVVEIHEDEDGDMGVFTTGGDYIAPYPPVSVEQEQAPAGAIRAEVERLSAELVDAQDTMQAFIARLERASGITIEQAYRMIPNPDGRRASEIVQPFMDCITKPLHAEVERLRGLYDGEGSRVEAAKDAMRNGDYDGAWDILDAALNEQEGGGDDQRGD